MATGPTTPGDAEEARLGWRMAGLAFLMSSEVMAGALLGWFYDQWRGEGKTGILVGSIIGICVGLWSLLRGAYQLNRMLSEKEAARRGRRGSPESAQQTNEPTDPTGSIDD